MNINEIVQQLRQERNKLEAAIQALESISGGSSATGKRRGRPPGTATKQSTSAPARKRAMSPAARKRISEMMRKRWAERKRAQKK
jgi:hypothetical protein